MSKELIISGKVQGVFCRRFCTLNARKLSLKGSASNLSDGTVRVILDTDDREKVNEFINNLKQNPHGFDFFGRIDNVTVSDYSGTIHGDYFF